eukprot:SAG25_NODE_616_length_6484_cov_3.460141_1_plen_183_part_00
MAARARIPTFWIVCATHRRKSLTLHDVSQAQASVQAARRGGGAQVMSLVERAAVQRLVDGLEVCMHAQPVHITTSPPPPPTPARASYFPITCPRTDVLAGGRHLQVLERSCWYCHRTVCAHHDTEEPGRSGVGERAGSVCCAKQAAHMGRTGHLRTREVLTKVELMKLVVDSSEVRVAIFWP